MKLWVLDYTVHEEQGSYSKKLFCSSYYGLWAMAKELKERLGDICVTAVYRVKTDPKHARLNTPAYFQSDQMCEQTLLPMPRSYDLR